MSKNDDDQGRRGSTGSSGARARRLGRRAANGTDRLGRCRVLARFFHRWERRLASVSTNRVARPFEWGVDWLAEQHLPEGDPRRVLQDWGEATVARSEEFYSVTPADDAALTGDTLTFTSAIMTPHPENNTVRARYFPDPSARGRKRAVLVMAQWNSDAEGHVGLCRLLNRFGISALRLSLPYHDPRMPPALTRRH